MSSTTVIKNKSANLFKLNNTNGIWSRVLLKADGKTVPYQNELILTPPTYPEMCKGFPVKWSKIEELWVVKFFHQTQPKDVTYFDELPAWLITRLSENVSPLTLAVLLEGDLEDRLHHVRLGTGIPVKGKTAIIDFDKLFGEEILDAQSQ